MSPNPGEEDHETRGWTHAICDAHYFARAAAKGWGANPSRVVNPDHDRQPVSEPCCYCGNPTRGIYIRADPKTVHGVPA